MKILITGVPGTGKTTLAKELAMRLNYKYINEKEMLTQDMYVDARVYGQFVKDVDIEKFELEVLKIEDNVVLDGLLFPETKLKYDFAFVLHLEEKKLRQRLKKRGYADAKIEDNVFAQNHGYLTEVLGNKSKNTYFIERKSIKEDLQAILDLISHQSL